MIYGYIRVSSKEQNEDRQRYALEEYAKTQGVKYDGIFMDKVSGKSFERNQYQALKKVVNNGDTIVVKELDRLGRNYKEIKEELAQFKSRGVKVKILDLPGFDVEDEALEELLNSLMIELLGYIAQKEREKIHQRQSEGIKQAKERGVKFGRPKRELPKNFDKYYKMFVDDEITGNEFARLMGASRRTIYRYMDEYEKNIRKG